MMRLLCLILVCAFMTGGCATKPAPQTIVYEPFDPPVKAVHVISAEYVPDERHGAGIAQGGYGHVLQKRVARPVKKGEDDPPGYAD